MIGLPIGILPEYPNIGKIQETLRVAAITGGIAEIAELEAGRNVVISNYSGD
jgi:hypothetical protein